MEIDAEKDYKFYKKNRYTADELRVYAITLKVIAEREIIENSG